MITYFQIGPVRFSVSSPVNFPWDDDIKIFQISELLEDDSILHYEIHFVTEFAPLWGNVLYSDSSMLVMNIQNREHRIHLLPSNGEPFAVTTHVDDTHIQVYIDVRVLPAMKWNRALMGLFSLEHYSLLEDAFLLHASYIIYQNQAIVFAAPSGTGKSTQADLWQMHENAEIINGDRTLLVKKGNKWYASGFPICGSSIYCKNQIAPIAAIVCLEKASENTALRLSASNAMKFIYSQSFVNRWNADDCAKISELIITLTENVPVYKYACTKEPDAVQYLKDTIFLETT